MADDKRGLLQVLGSWAIGAIERATGSVAPAWHWPSNQGMPGWWGNGDRGPVGSWQMNRNAPQAGLELLAFSAVYACINTIASDLSKLPLQVFEVDMESGARKLRRTDYYAQLMREPNTYQTASDFMFAFVQSYLLQGNTYCYCGKRNRRGEITELHVLRPYNVRPLILQDGTGQIFYEINEDWLAGITLPDQRIPERDIIHHRLPLLPGYPLVGVTPIFAAAASSAVGLQILRESQQFFGNASRPSGLLSTEQHMSDDLKARYKQEWDLAYRGAEFGKTAVLSGGMKWQPLTITAQDAQLIEQLRYSVEDVARVFRVPPFMLGDLSKVTYRNNETLVRIYMSNCLGFHIEALEQRLSRAFDFPQNFEIRFDLSGFLRTEIDVRFDAYAKGLNGGWISANEVRAQEGLEPVEGGDEPRVQMQYVPLSDATGPPPAPAAPPPPPEATIDPSRVRSLLRERMRRAA
jgi:HK97 family phage portal protein